MIFIKGLMATIALSLLFTAQAIAHPLVQLDRNQLESVKNQLDDGTAPAATQQAYQRLIQQADALLDKPNPTVMNKNFSPPSEDKHDYLSISRYWWPDDSQPDGLPWIRRDGETNPATQTDDVDRQRLGRMADGVRTLALAYYFSGNSDYARKGTSMIRTWFLDDATRMNPHLNYAQSVPGHPEGRRSGILDGRLIPERVLDSLVLFADSDYWEAHDEKEMTAWLENYLTWLTQSDLGIKGAQQTNNHGSWYKFQIAALSWYLDDEQRLDATIEATKNNLVEQFAADGSQPEELSRTRSFFYSTFNLEALTRIAIVADRAGKPIWNYQTPQGNSLTSGIEYLLPVAQGQEWQYPTPGVDLAYLAPLLVRIDTQSDREEYASVLEEILQQLENNTDRQPYQEKIFQELALLSPQYLK